MQFPCVPRVLENKGIYNQYCGVKMEQPVAT